MDGKDRRRYPRLEGHFQVDVLNMGDDPNFSPEEAVVPGEALDLSKHGMRLRSVYNAPVGSFLSVIAYYKGRDSVCLCEVMWKANRESHLLYGLFVKEWSRLDPALEARLISMEDRPEAVSDTGGLSVASSPL